MEALLMPPTVRIVYAFRLFHGKGAHEVVKIGCTSSKTYQTRLRQFPGISDDDVLATTLDDTTVVDVRNKHDGSNEAASGLEQELLSLFEEVSILCPDEWPYSGLPGLVSGRTEIFYASMEAWETLLPHFDRLDISKEAKVFLAEIFMAIHGGETLGIEDALFWEEDVRGDDNNWENREDDPKDDREF